MVIKHFYVRNLQMFTIELECFSRRHDTQHNDTQYNDIQHNGTQNDTQNNNK